MASQKIFADHVSSPNGIAESTANRILREKFATLHAPEILFSPASDGGIDCHLWAEIPEDRGCHLGVSQKIGSRHARLIHWRGGRDTDIGFVIRRLETLVSLLAKKLIRSLKEEARDE